MLKKIMVTSPILILFLFSISFLPLTQITEAEAQFSNKIQKPTHPSKAIKKPIEVNKARNFNKIQKQRSLSDAIKKPKGATVDKNLHLDDPPHIANLVGNTYSALLYELWIADRIDYLSAAAMNQSVCDEPGYEPITVNDQCTTQEVARDPAPIFIDEIRSLLFYVLQCGENTDPHDVPGHFVPTHNYCGSHEDYLNMIRTGWQAPPVTEYKMHTALHESCRIPRTNIFVPHPLIGTPSYSNRPAHEEQWFRKTWYWDRRVSFSDATTGRIAMIMRAMNDADGNCTHHAIGNNIKEACDIGVPTYLTIPNYFDESDIDMTWPGGRNGITQSLRNNIKLRPPQTPPGGTRPSTTEWYRYDQACYRELMNQVGDN
jgi:hypothetical protein